MRQCLITLFIREILKNIDTSNIVWRRVVDLNDRALRNIVVGLGGKVNGVPREDGFDISVASEVINFMFSNFIRRFKKNEQDE